jgi:hypothetical protein
MQNNKNKTTFTPTTISFQKSGAVWCGGDDMRRAVFGGNAMRQERRSLAVTFLPSLTLSRFARPDALKSLLC